MPLEVDEISRFLGRLHIFRQLNLDQLMTVAGKFTEVLLPQEEVLFRQGQQGDSFYIVFQGKIHWVRRSGGRITRQGFLLPGDYLGEEALIMHRTRSATISAAEDTVLLRLTARDFMLLIRQVPQLRTNLNIAISSRRLFRKIKLTWLNKGEIVHLLVRRHRFFLLRRMILPGLAALTGLVALLLIYLYNPPLAIIHYCAWAWLVGAMLFTGWEWLDWSNDYFIVTDQRVVWEERIALIYESRQESPLNTILSIGVDSTQIGRILHYGNVEVRTYGGVITLANVGHPEVLASMVDEYWKRSREIARKEDAVSMERAIRQSLGMMPPAPPRPLPPPAPTRTIRPGFLQRQIANLFRVRYDVGETVTYRKHPLILLEAIWIQTILFLAGAAVIIFALMGKFSPFPPGGIIAVTGLLMFVDFLWWLYEFIDWLNDIYQVTPDQILDIERKPLSLEKRQAAPLDNVLSFDAERHGILGLIFNYGSVYIKVGVTTFDFKQVFDPSQVQQDIFRRKQEREAKKKQRELQAEQERLAEWFAVYHRGFGEKVQGEPEAGPIEAFGIAGRVMVANEIPLAGVTITESPGKRQAVTDKEGRFFLDGLFPGVYTLTPSLAEYSFKPETYEADLGAADLEGVNFTATQVLYSIKGTISAGGLLPLTDVTISAGKNYTTRCDTDGNFKLSGLPAGRYVVSPSRPEYYFTPASRSVVVGPAAEAVDFIGLQNTYRLYGRVLDEDGKEMVGVIISAGSGRTATTDVEGRYVLSNLPPGSYMVTPASPGFIFSPRRKLVLLAPANGTAVFTGSRVTYSIQGMVTSADGAPLAGVTVDAGNGHTALTGPDGCYELSDLPAGVYLLRASLPGATFEPGEALVTVGPDQAGIDFKME